MESLHDICMQLMKPPKDLAQWNYPLGDMLAIYARLILETNDFKFTEAGLVVQNSANAYGKRIEYLFNEVLSFSSRVNTWQEEEKLPNPKERKKVSKKIDFDDFNSINVEAKDVHLKEDGTKKPMKLLPKQFLKVEKRFTGNSIETVMDVYGEIIGKKYDYRSNLDLNKYGILVEESTPEDFNRIVVMNDPAVKKMSNQCDLADDSGYDTLNSGFMDSEDYANENNATECDIDMSSQESHFECEVTGPHVEILDSCEKSSKEANVCDEASEQNLENSNLPEQSSETEKRQCEERQKPSEDSSSKMNTKWEPIPFDQGIPDKLPRKRREFKLPCHIDLLIKKPSRKRKRSKATKTLTDFLLDEEPRSKKQKTDQRSSPTGILNMLGKEHLDEFKKSFEMCLGSCLYDVPSIMMGFNLSFGKQSLPLDSPAHSTNMDDVPMLEPESLGIPDSYTPPTSPEDFGSFDQNIETISGKKNYDDIVKRKISDVQKSRKRTLLEETVMKWHETIKPKLAAAEKVKQFDINVYGTQILSTLVGNDERRILLSNVVRNQPKNEAARYFSAMLQLANSYNVDIKESSDASNVQLFLLKESVSGAADNFHLQTERKNIQSRKNS